MANMALTRAVRTALRTSPVTLRDLARRASVSHTLTAYLLRGTRAPTPVVAHRLAEALDAVAREATRGARAIRQALAKEST